MSQYNNQDDPLIIEGATNSRENKRYFNPFKSIPPYRIYQAITLTTSAAHALIQDAPRAMVGGVITITTSATRYFFKRRKLKTPQARTTRPSLDDSLNPS